MTQSRETHVKEMDNIWMDVDAEMAQMDAVKIVL